MKAYVLVCCASSSAAFSALSSFTRSTAAPITMSPAVVPRPTRTISMYDSSRDPPSSPEQNSWHVLASTERWISATLAEQNNQAGAGSNPYSRKEVSYDCETFSDSPMIVSNLFRRLRELRELGEKHGKEQQRMKDELAEGDEFQPKTFRRTQVVVIPGNAALRHSFDTFDNLVRTINEARRHARDYVTKRRAQDDDWSVSINCAHMHPDFGRLSKEQELEQLKNEPEEVDLNYQDYQERKTMARRSPYPTVVIEVRSMPPIDYGDIDEPKDTKAKKGISAKDVKTLEALFSMSAHFHDSTDKHKEDLFYEAIGREIKEVSATTPIQEAQQWMIKHDAEAINTANQVAFTESDTEHVDAAYEFLFTNIAMIRENPARQYLVMPNLLPKSATSMERFGRAALDIIDAIPELAGKVSLETFHPEHVSAERRSPMPIFALEMGS